MWKLIQSAHAYTYVSGVYLPLLWERSFCWRNPVALAYTRGHFSALVSMEADLDEDEGAGANPESSGAEQVVYLPLVDCEGKLLDVHFVSGAEVRVTQVLKVCIQTTIYWSTIMISFKPSGQPWYSNFWNWKFISV